MQRAQADPHSQQTADKKLISALLVLVIIESSAIGALNWRLRLISTPSPEPVYHAAPEDYNVLWKAEADSNVRSRKEPTK